MSGKLKASFASPAPSEATHFRKGSVCSVLITSQLEESPPASNFLNIPSDIIHHMFFFFAFLSASCFSKQAASLSTLSFRTSLKCQPPFSAPIPNLHTLDFIFCIFRLTSLNQTKPSRKKSEIGRSPVQVTSPHKT